MSADQTSISYTVDASDLGTFSAFHLRTSPAGRSIVRRQMVTLALLVTAFAVVVGVIQKDVEQLIGGLVVAAIAPFLLRPLYLWTAHRQAMRLIGKPDANRMLGPHRLSITSNELVEETDGGSLRTDLARVGPIHETDTHVFVYVAPALAHAIPCAKVAHGDLRAFVATLRSMAP